MLILLVWQVTTWEERVTGQEASTSTRLYPLDQARGGLVTSSEHTFSSMPATFAISTMVSSWKTKEHQCKGLCFMDQTTRLLGRNESVWAFISLLSSSGLDRGLTGFSDALYFCLAELMCLVLLRWGATSTFEETGRMHPLVVWTGHCAAFGKHCQAGAELLHSHGCPEWRQVGLVKLARFWVSLTSF